MSNSKYTKCSIFLKTAFLIIFINYCSSAPVNITESPYSQFIADLKRNKCSFPIEVQLPFNMTEVNNFEFLSSQLEICRNGSAKRNKEAVVLCNEIFGNVKIISCPMKTALPDIIVKLSTNVCKDIGALKDSVPEDDKSLLKRLTDRFLCEIMCDNEFEKACQVLLWSFEVQKLIASVANAQLPEQTNVQDGGEMNYNFKQENTAEESGSLQVAGYSENGKQNLEKDKDVNEVIDSDGITKAHELKDNTAQKFGEMVNSNKNEEQEKSVLSNKAVLENQSVLKAGSQDIAGASNSTGSLKTFSVSLQQTTGTSNSNTVVKPIGEIRKNESNVQNMNEQLQRIVFIKPGLKREETGAELPKKTNNDVATNEQTQAINVNIAKGKQVQDKKENILSNDHVLGNSNIPANPNILVNGEDVPDNEMSKEINENHNVLKSNLLPHESGNEKSPNDPAANLNTNEQDPSNIDIAQNKLQSTANDENKLGEKTHALTTGTQTTKDTTKHQTVQETTLDRTSLAREETKATQPQITSGLRSVETQDESKTGLLTHGLVTVEGNSNIVPNQKEQKVPQQTEESDNAISDTTETSVASKQKLPEKIQNTKTTALNPDDKSVIPSSLAETSTKINIVQENMEGGSDLRPPVDEEPDHYGDLENTEDDYSRRDYDGGFYEGLKNKESDPDTHSSPIVVAKEIVTNQNEKPIEFPSRNSFRQDSSDMIGFPEEDGHFFFYFLSIILILMGGYLIFHNKQKIIALIVEGRHERNRRSHRVGYKKLETK